jgi:hypothetical protein
MIYQTEVTRWHRQSNANSWLTVPAKGASIAAAACNTFDADGTWSDLQIKWTAMIRLSTVAGQTYQFELEVRHDPSGEY